MGTFKKLDINYQHEQNVEGIESEPSKCNKDEKALAEYMFMLMDADTKRVYLNTWNSDKLFFRCALICICKNEERQILVEGFEGQIDPDNAGFEIKPDNVMKYLYDLILAQLG